MVLAQDALQVAGVGQDKALGCLCQQQHTSKGNDPRQGRAHAASRSRDEGQAWFLCRDSRGSGQVWNLGRNRQSEQCHRSSCPPPTRSHSPDVSLEKSDAQNYCSSQRQGDRTTPLEVETRFLTPDAALGVNTSQAHRRMPAAPLAPLLTSAPSLHRQGDIPPKKQLIKPRTLLFY